MDETKEIKINIPEGYEIDKEHSTFECIKFKKKVKKINVWKDITYVTGFYIIISVAVKISCKYPIFFCFVTSVYKVNYPLYT